MSREMTRNEYKLWYHQRQLADAQYLRAKNGNAPGDCCMAKEHGHQKAIMDYQQAVDEERADRLAAMVEVRLRKIDWGSIIKASNALSVEKPEIEKVAQEVADGIFDELKNIFR